MRKEDVLETTKDISGREIRLTSWQWLHITESHDYMAGNIDKVMETVNSPDCLVEGLKGEILALKYYPKTNIMEKHCVVVYRERDKDGFIITAFFTSKPETIKRRNVIWKR
jgi:hypothetical protein